MADQSKVSQTGVYVYGKLVGAAERPWASDPSKVNYEVGIGRPFVNEWGEADVDVTRVGVPADRWAEIKAVCEKLKGQYVGVRVIVRARKGGREGAFLSFFMPKSADLVPQQ